MLTFRPTASGSLIGFLALTFLSQYIPGSQAQSPLPACASPCVTASIPTSGCSSANNTCICESNPFLVAFSACINESCSSDDIQQALTFYSIACAGEGPGFSIPATESSTTVSGSSSSGIPTLSSSVSTTSTTSSSKPTSSKTTTGTSTTSTPSSSSSPTNAAASLSGHAHAAVLMAGGIGALVAVAM
ncbi:hypothetical protein EDB92DRAFT_1350540 [Lactarius akahatsu]|uniref:CFEM domain-containing protein n=1 Tax=Lactarius akahatsu TaxID=416441 RepID=A0AAD4LEL1_9AGAM|nr:hypothetical protein EDB92DRAFT_1350540 [Lactarius akahatsu]